MQADSYRITQLSVLTIWALETANNLYHLALRFRVALLLALACVLSGQSVFAGTLILEKGVASQASPRVTFLDGSGEFRWKPYQGHSQSQKVSWQWDDVGGGLVRLSWQQRQAFYEGLVARYSCVIMCAWFKDKNLDPKHPYHRLDYRLDTVAIERPDWVLWQPNGYLELGVTPRLSLHAVHGSHSGEAGVLAKINAATLGTDISAAVNFGPHVKARWTGSYDRIAVPYVTLGSKSSKIAIEYWFDSSSAVVFAVRNMSTELNIYQNVNYLMRESFRDANLAIVVRWN